MLQKLVPWIIAIVIILVLAAIALPNFIKAGSRGYHSRSKSSLQSYPSATNFQSPGGSALPNAEPYDLTYFENYGVNPFIATEDENISTFGMDVDTASYTLARAWLQNGNLPDPDFIRTEEFINYFPQEYHAPKGDNVFSITTEGAESYFGQPNYHLLRIGIKVREVTAYERPPATMVFVVDVSGSMSRDDRLYEVKRCLTELTNNLQNGDRIGLVTYGTTSTEICDPTADRERILRAVRGLTPGGATNAAHGLRLAYRMARDFYDGEKINRIFLCSDGVANVGLTDSDDILEMVRQDASTGITLTTLGFGLDNFNDVLLEQLADNGDGMYFYIDSTEEAYRLFEKGAVGVLMTLAMDAKVQVDFNMDTVDRFRLLGYENRMLDTEDFKDDTVDAGEVNAGQTVTALYEVRIKDDAQKNPDARIATVRIRWTDSASGETENYHEEVLVADITRDFDRASERFRFTACVAEFAEVLRGSHWADDSEYSDILDLASRLARGLGDEEQEFIELVRDADRLSDM